MQSTALEYRLYFLDGTGHIEARHEFAARHDAEALWLGSLLADTCADGHVGWSLWCGPRLVTEKPEQCAPPHITTLRQLSAERQEQLLAQEEILQRSRFRIAYSRHLIELTAQLKEERRAPQLV